MAAKKNVRLKRPGQRVDGREADRGVARPALLARDDHRHEGQQDQGRQVDGHVVVVRAQVGLSDPAAEPASTATT